MHLGVEQLCAQALELGVAERAALVREELNARGIVHDKEVPSTLQYEGDSVLEVKDVRRAPVACAVDVALGCRCHNQMVETYMAEDRAD